MNFLQQREILQKIVLACYVAPNSGDAIHKDRKSHGVALHTSGVRRYRFADSAELTVKKNDLIFLPEHSDYIVETVESGACYAINFRIAGVGIYEPFVQHIQNASAFLEHFKSAERIYTAKKSGYEWKVMAETYAILYDLKREREKAYFTKREEHLLFPAVEYIHDHFSEEKLSVEVLAEMCGISSVYFRRLFAAKYGMPPVKYINNLRLSRAKELILFEQYSVEETARFSGFDDESYFCRFFKKTTGMTPSEYRLAQTENG
jgi:AraC-like DNA-binding protein